MSDLYAPAPRMSSSNVTVPRQRKSLVTAPAKAWPGARGEFSVEALGEQVALEEIDCPFVDQLRCVSAGEAVALTCECDVLDLATQLAKPVDDLVGLFARYARIVVALEHQ